MPSHTRCENVPVESEMLSCRPTALVVLMLVSISQFTAFILDFQNGDRPPSWILKLSACGMVPCLVTLTDI